MYKQTKKQLKRTMKRVKHYTFWDFAILKTCLFSLGVLVGVRYQAFFQRHLEKVRLIFAATYGMIMYRTFGPKVK